MLQTELEGDPTLEITGVSGIEAAGPGEVTFVANVKYESLLQTTKASAVIVGHDVAVDGPAVLRADDPYLCFGRLLAHFTAQPHHTGRHRNALVAPSATVAESAALHAGVVVEAGAQVEDDCVLYPGVYIGEHSRIGAGSLLYPNVVVRPRVHVGPRTILHSGVVLGASGSAVPAADPAAPLTDGPTVIVEADVELGAHTTVDRGEERPTTIGAGTKADNLVHIGSQAIVGPKCLLVAQVGIGAGAVIGASVTLAGQATVLPNVRVADGIIVTAKAGVEHDLLEAGLYSGTPAQPHEEARQIYGALRRLPRSRQLLLELERRLRTLERTENRG